MTNPLANPESQSEGSRFVVVGAGPSGLTAASELVDRNHQVTVLEQLSLVGGISRTEKHKGYHFDMGGHRFYTKAAEVNRFWERMLGDQFITRSRLSRIFYNGWFFPYPLKPVETVRGLGFIECVLILCSVIRWKLFPYREENTFEEWVTNRFGRRLFNTFFRTYTEKVWGISCKELKAEWAAQRISGLSLKTAVLNMFFRPRNVVKTLIEQFEYPRLGPGMMWEAVADHVREQGGCIAMEATTTSIQTNGKDQVLSITYRQGDEEVVLPGSHFLFSMPITAVIRGMNPPPPPQVLDAAKHLKYRDFLTVCLIIDKPDLFPDNWIYIHDSSVQTGRIQNYGNWSPDMVPEAGRSGLGLEYFCNVGDDLWNTPEEDLVELAKRELEILGLANASDVIDGVVYRVPKAYPVYDADYKQHLTVLRDYLRGFTNMQMIGRNGLHRYNNQDHAMLTGMYAVKNLLDGTDFDLWKVNGEQEYLEEIRRDDKGTREPASGSSVVAKPNTMAGSTADAQTVHAR